jgi:hypothetical protein
MATPQSIIKAINEPYSLTSDDVQAFREDGYIHLAGVLPDAVLEYYEPIISKITQEHDPTKIFMVRRLFSWATCGSMTRR